MFICSTTQLQASFVYKLGAGQLDDKKAGMDERGAASSGPRSLVDAERVYFLFHNRIVPSFLFSFSSNILTTYTLGAAAALGSGAKRRVFLGHFELGNFGAGKLDDKKTGMDERGDEGNGLWSLVDAEAGLFSVGAGQLDDKKTGMDGRGVEGNGFWSLVDAEAVFFFCFIIVSFPALLLLSLNTLTIPTLGVAATRRSGANVGCFGGHVDLGNSGVGQLDDKKTGVDGRGAEGSGLWSLVDAVAVDLASDLLFAFFPFEFGLGLRTFSTVF
ncbi:hypothetical protein DXG01_016376 [Tephrocybe rancida]|nr:hypothetical protein DXG01_016376 [Tephrocybe rancida]